MPQLTCPTCRASVDFEPTAASVRCPACNVDVNVAGAEVTYGYQDYVNAARDRGEMPDSFASPTDRGAWRPCAIGLGLAGCGTSIYVVAWAGWMVVFLKFVGPEPVSSTFLWALVLGVLQLLGS